MNSLGVRAILTTLLLIVPMTLGTNLSVHPTVADTDYFPEEEWRTSSPEQQGMDSSKLQEMLDYYLENDVSIDGIMVVKNGYIILEEYPSSYGPNSTHQIFSCTKSITSTLIGIAIDMGYIDDVNESILEYFSELPIENMDSWKESITLKHLLTMTAGFDWTEQQRETKSDFDQMIRASDWIQYVLNRPMISEPGTDFVYNTGASHLLSAILQTATGVKSLEFAQTHLFAPLGITEFEWSEDSKGITNGGTQLRLRPVDMAKVGYLLLRRGVWDGVQIVSPDWIDWASSALVNTTLEEAPGLVRDIGYGYQWWIYSDLGAFSAFGWGGQSIIVVPSQDIVVVITARSSDASIYANRILTQWILPAAGVEVVTTPLPDPLSQYIFGSSLALFIGYLIISIPVPFALALLRDDPEEDT